MSNNISVDRKRDHIDLAFRSQMNHDMIDDRFFYEPMVSGHPCGDVIPMTVFGQHNLSLPLWVSSMTGGTALAQNINRNLARACQEFGVGMGLGSCRSLLFSDDRMDDFAVKSLMPDFPLFANIGIAQVAELAAADDLVRLSTMVERLQADGLIIHVNPLQEWMQPEGDRYHVSPLDSIRRVIDVLPDTPLIVKEVGQGFGPKSMEALYRLPLLAVDFAAAGGTNFAMLEYLRQAEKDETHEGLIHLGHSAEEMVSMSNAIQHKLGDDCLTKHTIISGGVQNYLDGYYLVQSISGTAIYGQASAFLRHAMDGYDELEKYIHDQKDGLALAYSFLTVKK